MDFSFRTFAAALASLAIALIILLPNHLLIIAIAWLITQGIAVKACMRRVDEPERPIIMRLGLIHHLGPSGVFFLAPWIESLGDVVSMKPEYLEFTVTQLNAGDGDGVYMNLELTWRLRPDLDRIDEMTKLVLYKTIEQRRKFVEQGITVVARQLIHSYTSDQLKPADTREYVTEILRNAVNEYFAGSGIMIDTIFWRGSNPAKEVQEAKLKAKVVHEQVQGMVRDMELVKQRFPDISAEEFLAYSAWMDLIRRGISPPGVPNMPQFPVALPPPPPRAPPKAP